MNGILGYDKVASRISDFSFCDLKILRELHLYTLCSEDDDHTTQKIEIVLETENHNPNYCVRLGFSGVADLRLKDFGSVDIRIVGFDIYDMHESRWEKVSWKIWDYEEGIMQFYSETAEVLSVTATEGNREGEFTT